MPLPDEIASILHGAGAILGTASSAAIGAAYQRFLRLQRVTSKVEHFFTELREYPHAVPLPVGVDTSILQDLKKFVDDRVVLKQPVVPPVAHAPATVPRPVSGLSFQDAKKLADVVQRLDTLRKEVDDLKQTRLLAAEKRISETEDKLDEIQDREAEAWQAIREDLAWLRGKLGLPSPTSSGGG